jgi:hypothetical protein
MRVTAVSILVLGLGLVVARSAISQGTPAPSHSSGMSPQRLERVTGAIRRRMAALVASPMSFKRPSIKPLSIEPT